MIVGKERTGCNTDDKRHSVHAIEHGLPLTKKTMRNINALGFVNNPSDNALHVHSGLGSFQYSRKYSYMI